MLARSTALLIGTRSVDTSSSVVSSFSPMFRDDGYVNLHRTYSVQLDWWPAALLCVPYSG